ncbi:4'-phosphopantetheinyl transferase family protein [Fluviicola chungangensis]|uniref:4'-phosphopantetheinyl transferase superfamily protein n=1 Tax=Fluviicola chungangensis TaxID=2597671 RepID=A0A556N347_9FLAO|nr:4'-phosphopantetheinyl transferase superfamily protein [Fluviicola chungangensis]TSJ46479.1 4'-phosphopantetheinyl transferase superfamily protein [Fluviicola chungangensis]
MISIINNPNSTVAYFKQEDYDQRIADGINKRAVEKGGVQTLLQELGYDDFEIGYKATGQPYFLQKPELFLSVSHAKGWFALSVGFEPVGIDIQTFSSRLKQGQDYFRNERELPFSEDEHALHLIWGAKEAFYKLKEGQIPDLKEEVTLISISADELVIDFESEKVQLSYRLLENAFLVFTC